MLQASLCQCPSSSYISQNTTSKSVNTMPRSEEAEHWYNAVCLAVQQIPYGKITTYKHIAVLLDERTLAPLADGQC